MKVKLLRNVPWIFGYIGKGAEVDLPDKDAEKLVEAGYAEKPVHEIKIKKGKGHVPHSPEAKPSKEGKEV